MPTKSPPTWKQIRKFCEKDGWQELGKSKDIIYRKVTSDHIKRTKVSKGSGGPSKSLWSHILNKQLQVTEEYFWEKI